MADADEKTSIMIDCAERAVTPVFTLHQIGRYVLSKAQIIEKGSLLEIITTLVMCPLTMEAMLNHIGLRLFVEGDGGCGKTQGARKAVLKSPSSLRNLLESFMDDKILNL